MKADEICNTAARLVSGERERTHGDKVLNHQHIAAMWNGYLWDVLKRDLTPKDVALMMACLKVARTKLGAFNADDFVDLCGYGSVAGEIAARTKEGQ